MADGSPSQQKHGVSRFLGGRWRSRSNADETKNVVDQSKNLADFLGNPITTGGTSESTGSIAAANASRARLAPKIDIAAAQRWAGNANGTGAITPSSLLRGRAGSDGRKKPPRRPGLTVRFDDVPEVMGEGGEECEDPTMEISRIKAFALSAAMLPASSPVPMPLDQEPRLPSVEPSPVATKSVGGIGGDKSGIGGARDAAYRQLVGESGDKEDFVKPTLRRAPTGYGPRESFSSQYSDEGSTGPSSTAKSLPSINAPFKLPEFQSVVDNSPLDPSPAVGRLDPNALRPPVERTSKIQQMRQEEGATLHQLYRRSLIDPQELEKENIPATSSNAPATLAQPSRAAKAPMPPPASMSSYKAYSPADDSRSSSRTGSSTTVPAFHKPYTSLQQSYQAQPQSQSNGGARENMEPPSKALPLRNGPTASALPFQPGHMASSSVSSRSSPSSATPSFSNQPNLSMSSKRIDSPSITSPAQPSRGYSDARGSVNPSTQAKSTSSSASQAAFDDFAIRCEHMRGIFRLQGEFEKPLMEYTPTQWLRATTWWFVKGRAGMESVIRARPKSADGQRNQDQFLTQPHVDLAKAWWILSDVIPIHSSLPNSSDPSYSNRAAAAATAKDSVNAEFYDSCEIILSNLKALLSSMNKNNVMPPYNALIQGQDQTIWVQYPAFSTEMLPILSGVQNTSTKGAVFNPLSIMAVADTRMEFSYYRWFIKATLYPEHDVNDQISMLALFSLMRGRNEWHPKVGICTQKELLSVCVTGERKIGPSWEDVKWSETDFSIQIRLPRKYILNAQLAEPEYRILAGMYKKAFSVQTSLFPKDGEQAIFEVPLEDFQYSDTMRPPAFPLERMRRCRVRLFVCTETKKDGSTLRRFYRGMRVLVVTSPKNRTLADVSHGVDSQQPTILEMLSEDMPGGESLPAMRLHIKEDHRQVSLYMVFREPKERQKLYSALTQIEVAPNEMEFANVRLKKLSIEPTTDVDEYPKAGQNPLGRMQWQEVVVLNKRPRNPDDDLGEAVHSDNLRILAQGVGGTIVDRINLGPGELKLKLAYDGTPNITLIRSQQDDLTMTFDRRLAPFTPEIVGELHEVINLQPTKRTFGFFNLQDMHSFQAAITGFKVKYDSLARDFTISRRRAVGTLSTKSKKLDAGLTRVQIVSYANDKVVQLLAFFDEHFEYATSMGFIIKSADLFERFDGKQSGSRAKFGVRLVDAKFTLHKNLSGKGAGKQEDISKGFLCLSLPENPAENDDIFIGFDEANEREEFFAALPVAANSLLKTSGSRSRRP